MCFGWDSFCFGGCFVFQTFIYLTLIFHVCIYLKNTSHTSQYRQQANDTGNLIHTTGHIPGGKRGQAGFWGQSNTNSLSLPHSCPKTHLSWASLVFVFLGFFFVTWFPQRFPCFQPSTPHEPRAHQWRGSLAHPQLPDFRTL